MSRDSRAPLPERACTSCGKAFTPQVGPRGGQPPKRCQSCRDTVRPLHAAGPSLTDLDQLATQARLSSSVDAATRERLLEVANLIQTESDTQPNHVLDVCARALRKVCGYGAGDKRPGDQHGSQQTG
jgi:hypothetical protein